MSVTSVCTVNSPTPTNLNIQEKQHKGPPSPSLLTSFITGAKAFAGEFINAAIKFGEAVKDVLANAAQHFPGKEILGVLRAWAVCPVLALMGTVGIVLSPVVVPLFVLEIPGVEWVVTKYLELAIYFDDLGQVSFASRERARLAETAAKNVEKQ